MYQKVTHYRGFFGMGIFSGLLVSVIVASVLAFTSSESTSAAGSKAYDQANLAKVTATLQNPKTSLENMSTTYHGTVNAIFNDYIDQFTNIKDGDKKVDGNTTLYDKKTQPPKDDKECAKTGNDMNISTYCLYLRIDDLYEVYYNALLVRGDTAAKEVIAILNNEATQTKTLNESQARASWTRRELETSKKTLDTSLKAYSELLTQFPLHQEYAKTIKLLVKYYDHLTDIRKKVDTYPTRFQDVSTQDCQ